MTNLCCRFNIPNKNHLKSYDSSHTCTFAHNWMLVPSCNVPHVAQIIFRIEVSRASIELSLCTKQVSLLRAHTLCVCTRSNRLEFGAHSNTVETWERGLYCVCVSIYTGIRYSTFSIALLAPNCIWNATLLANNSNCMMYTNTMYFGNVYQCMRRGVWLRCVFAFAGHVDYIEQNFAYLISSLQVIILVNLYTIFRRNCCMWYSIKFKYE